MSYRLGVIRSPFEVRCVGGQGEVVYHRQGGFRGTPTSQSTIYEQGYEHDPPPLYSSSTENATRVVSGWARRGCVRSPPLRLWRTAWRLRNVTVTVTHRNGCGYAPLPAQPLTVALSASEEPRPSPHSGLRTFQQKSICPEIINFKDLLV
jgi:hypothetical protein